MLTEQRYEVILKLLEEKNSITVAEVKDLLNTSESTVRRDITALHNAGKLVKVFGGAVACDRTVITHEPTVEQKAEVNVEAKQLVAAKAAALIRPEDFRKCHDLLRKYGMQTSEQDMDAEELESVYEVPYGKKGSLIYIELHKSLFPPESEAYGDLNRFFANVHEDAIDIRIDGTDIRTMGYTDHLFYLICHSFKHFLHSGFGIRQVCDIILFANEYGYVIDWEKVLRQCREIHADLFAAALFAIGEKYLTFDPEKAHYPKVWQGICVDETDMLMDLLDSGIYGNANMSRKHSSNMTLDAVAADKNGKKAGNTVLKSLFPSAKKLEGRYPYLKKHPILLPIAWTDRILKYRKETVAGGDNAAADSVKIGNQRIELMKEYGIIKNDIKR